MAPAGEGPASQQLARWLHAAQATHYVHHMTTLQQARIGEMLQRGGAKLRSTPCRVRYENLQGAYTVDSLSLCDWERNRPASQRQTRNLRETISGARLTIRKREPFIFPAQIHTLTAARLLARAAGASAFDVRMGAASAWQRRFG